MLLFWAKYKALSMAVLEMQEILLHPITGKTSDNQ